MSSNALSLLPHRLSNMRLVSSLHPPESLVPIERLGDKFIQAGIGNIGLFGHSAIGYRSLYTPA